MAAKVLVDDVATSSTDAVTSDLFRPHAGAVSSSYLVYSSGVAGTVDLEVDLGGDAGWQPYISDEAVSAGGLTVLVSDVPTLTHRVVITPDSGTASTWRVLAASAGQQ